MALQATAARSSRITKPHKPTGVKALGLRRTTSSPSSASPRKKALRSEYSISYDGEEQLDDTGVVASLANDLNFRDVPQFTKHIRNNMFSDIPEKAGMKSVRIAEVLNYRKKLPPFVTIAHIDALSKSSTTVEREVAELAQAGVLRRIVIPNRGVGAAGAGDGIASVREWHDLVRSNHDLMEELKDKYIAIMTTNATSMNMASTLFTPAEISSLLTTGFLTSTSILSPGSTSLASSGTSSLSPLSSSGSRYAAGSLDAVGGMAAIQHIHGGTALASSRIGPGFKLNFSLPNTGTYIKLLVDARAHLLSLVKKTKYEEMPLDTLRERWNGNVTVRDGQTARTKHKGEFTGVVAGRTKKWRQFYGMRFEWVLEECVGAGLIELFETGSVGRAARIAR